jgi:hypothetical protein
MLKATVKIKLTRKLSGKCLTHPGYNPERGPGQIKGNCAHCLALYEAIKARDSLIVALRDFEDASKAFEVIRKPRSGKAVPQGAAA